MCVTGNNTFTIHSKITDIGEGVVNLQFHPIASTIVQRDTGKLVNVTIKNCDVELILCIWRFFCYSELAIRNNFVNIRQVSYFRTILYTSGQMYTNNNFNILHIFTSKRQNVLNVVSYLFFVWFYKAVAKIHPRVCISVICCFIFTL